MRSSNASNGSNSDARQLMLEHREIIFSHQAFIQTLNSANQSIFFIPEENSNFNIFPKINNKIFFIEKG